MSTQPSGMQSAQGSDGSYSDRQTQPGFPSGEAQPVQSGNSFDNQGQSPAPQGGGPATGGPS